MARILIFGGHGKVALLLESLLVERGDEVWAVIRNPAHADDVAATGATPVVADVEKLDTEEIAAIVRGHDAVVWSAGAGGGDAARTYAVDRDAAIRSIDGAEVADVHRYVLLSWAGSREDHGISPDDLFYAYADAKLAADRHVRASPLDWTVLGPGALTSDEPTGRITTAPTGRAEVGRADVAAVIAQALVEPATVGKTIRFGAGETPIVEALRG